MAVLLKSVTPQLAAGASSLIFPCLTSPHCAHRLHPLPSASGNLSSEATRTLQPTFSALQPCYYSLETGVKGTHLCPSLPPAGQSILICRDMRMEPAPSLLRQQQHHPGLESCSSLPHHCSAPWSRSHKHQCLCRGFPPNVS